MARELAFCGTHFHNDQGWVIAGAALQFRVNVGTVPTYLNQTNALNSILFGADNWNSHQDWCGLPDQSNLQFTYLGTTGAQAGTYNDGNTVSWRNPADICAAATNLACAPYQLFPGTANISEGDVLLSSSFGWNTTAGAALGGRYDIEGVSTHEFGHIAGFAHVNSTGEVMFPNQDAGTNGNGITNRQLGRGDAEYSNTKY